MKLPKELKDRKDLGGTAGKKKQCSVTACNEFAIRSLSENKWKKILEKAGMKIDENKLHKIYLCKKHYNEGKKVWKRENIQKKGFLENSAKTKKGRWLD